MWLGRDLAKPPKVFTNLNSALCCADVLRGIFSITEYIFPFCSLVIPKNQMELWWFLMKQLWFPESKSASRSHCDPSRERGKQYRFLHFEAKNVDIARIANAVLCHSLTMRT